MRSGALVRFGCLLLAALAAWAVAWQPAAVPSGEPPAIVAPDPARSTEAFVLSVQDGDSVTLLINGESRRFELLGADTPEWVDRASRQRPYAAESRRFLTNMLLSERVLVFEPEPGAADQLGRRRAYLFRLPDMSLVDLEIIRQGYGRVSTRAGEPYAPALRWYEQRAKELQRGVWGEAPEPETAPADPAPTPVVQAPAETTPAQPVPVESKPEPKPEDGWVWVTRSGSRYHREGCSHLTSSRTRVRLDSIKSTHEPCKTCNPDG